VRQRLEDSGQAVNSREEADQIFRIRLGLSPAQRIQFARGEVGPQVLQAVDEALLQREQGLPLAYCLGRAEFCGNSFFVSPDVLIPRPETEWLVQRAEDWLRDRRYGSKRGNERLSLLDLGCGSGCIGLSLALRHPALRVTLADVSEAALDIAAQNARRLGVIERCEFRSGDWFEWARRRERFDAILCNPPYVTRTDDPLLDESVKAHEPSIALFLHEDPYEFFLRLLRRASAHLSAGGLVAVEVGYDTAWPARSAFDKVNQLSRGHEIHDFCGIERVVWGIRK
jgi:release factor glutamine methyltransferase